MKLGLVGKELFAATGPQAIVSELQKVPGARYDSGMHSWVYPIESYTYFLAHFKGVQGFTVEQLPESALKIAQTQKTTPNSRSDTRSSLSCLFASQVCSCDKNGPLFSSDYTEILKKALPKKLNDRLMDFQRAGIIAALKMNGRVLIGDEMGLGKTVQALSVAKV